MNRYHQFDNRHTTHWGIVLILCALILGSSVSCASKGSSKNPFAFSSVSTKDKGANSAQANAPKKNSSSGSWMFWKKKKVDESPSMQAETDSSPYQTSDSVQINRENPSGYNNVSSPIYSDSSNTSASVQNSSTNSMAYNPNGPIEVQRLPAATADPVPETAPINPAMGNDIHDERNRKTATGILPEPQASTIQPTIKIEGSINGGATFRGQGPATQMPQLENQPVYSVRVLSDVPLSEAQSVPSNTNINPNGYASPVLEDDYRVNPAYNGGSVQAGQNYTPNNVNYGYPQSFTQPQGGIQSAWTPPGIQPPNGKQWPEDEFIADGGMGPHGVKVHDDFSVSGLHPENTIVHYDTIDGKVGIEASNRVEIYAPKFASVRQVVTLGVQASANKSVSYDSAQLPISQERTVGAMQSKQNLAFGENIAAQPGEQFIGKNTVAETSNRRQLMAVDNKFQAYEDFKIIKTGQLDRSETAMLAESQRRAAVWNYKSQPQVIINNKVTMEAVKDEGPGILYSLRKDTRNPQVRIIKLANVEDARSGDHVEFTIRFDNIGDEPVGNVTILDSLSGRLEYAEGTAQCSVKGAFMTEPNSADSLVLRWEIEEPLLPGEGGIIRFECIVR